jgi:hypothetical protein
MVGDRGQLVEDTPSTRRTFDGLRLGISGNGGPADSADKTHALSPKLFVSPSEIALPVRCLTTLLPIG